jgi:DNA polymerase
LSYAFDDEAVSTWTPEQSFPSRIAQHFVNGGQIRVHNASFDRLILWHVVCPDFGVPEPRLEQFFCTSAQARANCAPGSLEDVGRFASSDMRKDHRGAQLIRLLCIPQADGTFREDAALMREMIAYCEQDVRTMREISKALRDLSDDELRDYHVNERINDRGVRVDVPLCAAAQVYAEAERVEIEALVRDITKGEVTSVRSPRMRQWVLERIGPEARKLAKVTKGEQEKDSLDKSVRANLLVLAEEDPAEVPPDVADVLQCADDLWASSVAKFARLQALADVEDARVRGAFVFAGGAATGRASSYGAQVHNFTRKVADDPASVREAMVRRHQIVPKFGARVTDVLRGMLRPALIPAPGHVFVGADWSAIEGRVHPWLSDSPAGERKLDVFRRGLDPYKVNAAATFGARYEDVTGEQRQIGKVQELALGFLGGVGAFETFGRAYGVRVPPAEARRAVDGWRQANPWAQEHGWRLDAAARAAMRSPGKEVLAARVAYYYDREHLWYILPSGRILRYPYARFDADGSISYAKAAWKPSADATEWPRARLWAGLQCENVTQAAANDILRSALRRLEGRWAVVLHVHDEVVLEVPRRKAEAAQEDLLAIMREPPPWASGLPLDAKSEIMDRYC